MRFLLLLSNEIISHRKKKKLSDAFWKKTCFSSKINLSLCNPMNVKFTTKLFNVEFKTDVNCFSESQQQSNSDCTVTHVCHTILVIR